MAIQKFLYLLRHGEAEPGIGYLGDIKRKLSKSGENQIKSLSERLKSQKTNFDLILVSSSERTTQTAKIISDAIPSKGILIEDEIYDAELNDLLKILQNIENQTGKVLLVGHNPSISSLVSYLTGVDLINLSPGMLARIEIVVDDWKDIGIDTGILLELVT